MGLSQTWVMVCGITIEKLERVKNIPMVPLDCLIIDIKFNKNWLGFTPMISTCKMFYRTSIFPQYMKMVCSNVFIMFS